MSIFRSATPKATPSSQKPALIALLCLLALAQTSKAQFFRDTSEKASTKRIWISSLVLPGSGQIINRQYWKVPIYYAGTGSFLYYGIKANKNFKSYYNDYSRYNPAFDPKNIKEQYKIRYTEQRNTRNLCFAAAGAFYVAGVLDAVIVHNKGTHSPTTATILSSLVPGAGQAYNKKYWKIPVVYGGLAGLYYGAAWNNKMYDKFKTALIYRNDNDASTVEPNWSKNRSDSNLEYYMDDYHSYRDMCVLGIVLVYVANILDANVDAHLFDWNVDDDLSFKVEPTMINNDPISTTGTGVGLALKVTF